MPVNSFDDYPMTWRPVLAKRTGTLYKALADQLESDIKNGVLRPGIKLPPQRELADYLDINLSTVTKAFKVCTLKGLLSANVGRGTYVSYDALTSMYLWPDGGGKTQLISLGATHPDDVSCENIREQLAAMLTEPDCAKWFDYGDESDMAWHRRAGAIFMNEVGYAVQPENVVLTNGGQNALMAALAAVCSRGDRIGADPETYPGLKTGAAMLGIELVPIVHENGEMCMDSLLDACRKERVKGLYLMPQNQNPTTHTMSEKTKQEIVRIAREKGLIIFEDAAYNFFSRYPHTPIAHFLPEQTFFIASLSKALAPGLRLAYLAVPPQYQKAVKRALYNMSITVSPLMSELAARLIVSGSFRETIASHRTEIIRRDRIVKECLQGLQCDGEETCGFRWLHLPPGMSGNRFEKLALENKVQVYAAERFVVGNSTPTPAVRISITTPKTHEELERGLMILKKLLCRKL